MAVCTHTAPPDFFYEVGGLGPQDSDPLSGPRPFALSFSFKLMEGQPPYQGHDIAQSRFVYLLLIYPGKAHGLHSYFFQRWAIQAFT